MTTEAGRRRFVARDDFGSMSHDTAAVDNTALRLDQAAVADHDVVDPYEQEGPSE